MMRDRRLGTLVRMASALALVLVIASCERAPDVANSQSYAKGGISFRLPGNWSVTKDIVKSGRVKFRYIVVKSPGHTIVLMQCFERRVPLSIERFAENFHAVESRIVKGKARLGNMSPFDEGDAQSTPIQAVVSGVQRPGIQQSFSISALGKPVAHRLQAFKVETADGTVFLVAQAPEEDWSLVEPGVDQVLSSFRAD